MGKSLNEQHALVAITHQTVVSRALISKLLLTMGSALALQNASVASLTATNLISDTKAALLLKALSSANVASELDSIQQLAIQIIPVYSDAYPPLLKQIHDPPALLFVRGNLPDPAVPTIAIIGTRNPSHYGLWATSHIARELAQIGIVIVSGFALGIDTQAHKTTLEEQGTTLAVLGCGHAVTYPIRNRALAQLIVTAGAIVSEFPIHTPPYPTNFPVRNRIISGLSLGVIVIEATEKSGALITANLALEQNRDVFAVPGPINSPLSRGPHALIKQGAVLVGSVEDILVELPYSFAPHMTNRSPVSAPLPVLSEEQEHVLSCFDAEGVQFDELVLKSGRAAAEIGVILTELELAGIITTLPGKRYRRNFTCS